jgi:hypothetical protein
MRIWHRDSPKWAVLEVIILALGIWAAIVYSGAWAATATRPYYFPDGDGLDSVEIDLYKNGTLTDSIRDSIETFPITGNLTIDDGNQWRIIYWRYFVGNDTPVFSDEIVWGWTSSTPAGVPGGSYVCRIYGTAIGADGDSLEYATVIFTAPKGNCSCDSTIMPTKIVEVLTERSGGSNWKGYFQADLIWSSCLGDKKYEIEIIPDAGERTKGTPFLVPDSTTYKLYW